MKKKISFKNMFALGVFLVFGFCFLVFSVIYYYIQSQHFKNRVEVALADFSGDQIEIGGQLKVVQLVPTVKLVLPSIKIQSTNPTSRFERLRADDLSIALPARMLVGGFQTGSVHLNLAKISVVARTAKISAVPDAEVAAKNVTQTIDDFRRQYPELELSAFIEHIDYITRDGENLHYELDKLAVNISTERIAASGQYPRDGINSDQISFQLDDLSPVSHSTNEQLKAKLVVVIVPYRNFQGIDETPINITSSVDVQGNKLILTNVDYRGLGLWARGNLFVDPAENRTKIKTDIELRKFELAGLFSNGEDSPSSRKLFNKDPLDLEIFDQIDLDVQVYMGAVRLNNEPVINGQVNFESKDGQFLLSSENLTLFGGKSDLSLSVRQLQKDVEFRLKLTSEDMQLDRLRVDRSNATVLERGTGDIIIALHGVGASTASIAGSLNGYVTATVSDAYLKRKYVSLIDQGIVSWARNKISFISKKQKPETIMIKESRGLPLDCASLRLFINDGRVEVTNGAIIELPKNTLVGSGYIDLHNEQLGFVVRTKSESLFDWSAISIIEYLEIDGSLINPGFGLDLGTLAKQGVLSTASFIYGPLPSLVYSLAEAGLKGRDNIRCIPEIN